MYHFLPPSIQVKEEEREVASWQSGKVFVDKSGWRFDIHTEQRAIYTQVGSGYNQPIDSNKWPARSMDKATNLKSGLQWFPHPTNFTLDRDRVLSAAAVFMVWGRNIFHGVATTLST